MNFKIFIAIIINFLTINHDSIKCSTFSCRFYQVFVIDDNLTGLTIEFSSDFNNFQNICSKIPKKLRFLTLVSKTPVIYKQNSSFSYYLGSLSLIGFDGFDIKSYTNELFNGGVQVFFSKVNFYLDNHLINDNCRILSDSNLEILFIRQGSMRFLAGTIYNKRYCIELFKNSLLYTLEFDQLSETFLRNNHLKLISDNLTNQSNFQPSIYTLIIKVYNSDADKDIFNYLLYRFVSCIAIKGNLKSIEPLFGNLYLMYFFLKILNIKYILYKSNEWINSFNTNVDPVKDEIQIQNYLNAVSSRALAVVFYNVVDFGIEDNDFCIFMNFPFERLVTPILINPFTKNCSCTLLWLTRLKSNRSYFRNDKLDINIKIIFQETTFGTYNACSNTFSSKICNISDLKRKCFKTGSQHTNYQSDKNNYYEISFSLNVFEYVTQIILLPILCFSGIVFSIVSLITLRNKKN